MGQTRDREERKRGEREREGVVIHLADNHKLHLEGFFFPFIIKNRWENRLAAE